MLERFAPKRSKLLGSALITGEDNQCCVKRWSPCSQSINRIFSRRLALARGGPWRRGCGGAGGRGGSCGRCFSGARSEVRCRQLRAGKILRSAFQGGAVRGSFARNDCDRIPAGVQGWGALMTQPLCGPTGNSSPTTDSAMGEISFADSLDPATTRLLILSLLYVATIPIYDDGGCDGLRRRFSRHGWRFQPFKSSDDAAVVGLWA